MQKLLFLLLITFALVSCKSQGESYGEKINSSGAVAVSEIPTMLASADSVDTKVEGKIAQCCQKKGCWMKMDMGDGEELMVTFKDYGFFVPLESGGKTAIIEGRAKKRLVPVMELRHYAEDAGASKEEIEKITEPEEGYSFVATGVIIKD